MGKIKSALLLVLYTLLIAFLCFICTVSFNYGENDLHTFSSILDLTAKDADLGGTYGANDTYSGGGYSAVYYPEGVISVSEYEDDLAGISDEKDRTDYQNKYRASENGALYLEVGTACDENGAVLASFTEAFASAVETMTARYEALHADGARVSVRDDYTIEVFLPEMLDGEYYTISRFAYTGELSLTYGTSEDAATDVLKVKRNESVSDYVTGVSSRSSGGTHYIELHFTQKGADALAEATADAGSSSDSSSSSTTNYLYIYVGDTAIISLQVSEALTGNALYISGSYTAETAAATAILLDSAVDGTADDLTFTAGDAYQIPAAYGANALIWLYISFGVLSVAMMLFFFIRYGLLGFVHLYTYLLFTACTILCVWAIPFLYLSVEVYVAFLFTALMLSAGNAVTFEAARKEFALGKTFASSVKTGYKKTFWKLFDAHIVVALFGFIAYFIAFPSLQAAMFVLGLTAVFSGLGVLLFNRFAWAIMTALTKKPGKFCNFKREEVDDE